LPKLKLGWFISQVTQPNSNLWVDTASIGNEKNHRQLSTLL